MKRPGNRHENIRAIITGGGTGGHLFPGIAIAESLRETAPGCELLFVGTGSPIEKRVLPGAGFAFERISAEGIKGRGALAGARAILKLCAGVFKAARLIVKFKPDVVIGMGGYSSAPVVICAMLLGKRIVICEQNALPGITNRLLSRFADWVCVSHEQAAGRLSAKRVSVTGNPVRKSFLKAVEDAGESSAGQDSASDGFTVFIVGGSQGAHGINMAVTQGLAYIDQELGIKFVHQTGEADLAMVRKAYESHGMESVVEPFFNDMACWYRIADLVICRAGATTVAEVTCMGKPCIFVPFPGAADDHQTYNAKALVDAGAAEMIAESGFTGKVFADRVVFYASHRGILAQMSKRCRQMGKPDAARRVAKVCLAVASGKINSKPLVCLCT